MPSRQIQPRSAARHLLLNFISRSGHRKEKLSFETEVLFSLGLKRTFKLEANRLSDHKNKSSGQTLLSPVVFFSRPPIDHRPQQEVPEDQGIRRSYDRRCCDQHLVSVCWCTRPVASAVLCSGRYNALQYPSLTAELGIFVEFLTSRRVARVMDAAVLCQTSPLCL